MPVDGHAQIEHDALAGHLHRPGLQVFEGEPRHEDGEVRQCQPLEAVETADGDEPIDGQLDQVRLRELRRRAGDDGDERDADLAPVRPQVRQQPAHQTRVVRLAEDFVVVSGRHDAASSSSSSCFL